MPSIEEAKRQVKAGLKNQQQQQQQHEVDHDAILASLWDEIDDHNGQSEEPYVPKRHRERNEYKEPRSGDRTTKFRFKDSAEPRKRKHRSRDDEHRRHRKHRKERQHAEQRDEGAHPFPREPTNPERGGHDNANIAFQESLFDALADDEGAAYWESVYSQPIHVFPRPTVQNACGELEEMNDEEYAAFVQTKMWEKKNPEIVLERERKEKQRKEEEEEKVRQRQEFVRRKQRSAWEKAQNEGARKFAGVGHDEDYEYVFDFEDRKGGASKRSTESATQQQEYRNAWKQYLAAWDKLKHELLQTHNPQTGISEEQSTSKGESKSPSKRIPWPVLQSKPVIKPNIEDFMRHIPLERDGSTREQMLKSERVRWHPDKVQQRFRGVVDEGTMKIVTGVFQVVDSLLEAERKH
ncbi:Putative NF-kappa-B inhibitor-like protein [Septoria linicola]|uniref:NF-kappa-B inhibitor-like protein n=1 Tax=Septoria linicola TaxID=215465 RepID=A0A9Q9AUU8_9PEZI|nr:putative NF-kappa-B inhibitor-like protein [Septoria linicola]USW52407.1 Putative NF-kappa-B inhibitor-like protein [Septoria linicola]